MAKGIKYEKISLEGNLSEVVELMKVFPEQERNSEEEIRRCLLAPPKGPYGIYIARDESGEGIGFSIWRHEDEGEAYFWLLGVTEKYRNNGVSKKLLDLSIQEISERGYSRMFLKTFESCPKVNKLCRQRDFREVGRSPCIWDSREDVRIEYVREFKKE